MSSTVDLLLSGFGSASLVTVAVLANAVPEGVAPGMLPVSVKVVAPPAVNVAAEHEIVPPAPIAGVVQPNGGPLCDSETNVIVPGSVSVSVTFVASLGPALKTVMVYDTFAPGDAAAGPLFGTPKSAAIGGPLNPAYTWVFSPLRSKSPGPAAGPLVLNT